MTVVSALLDIGIAIGPPLAYTDQIYNIIKRQNSSGFNTDICNLLLHANILRIFYFFGGGFDSKPLLIQAFIMIISQLSLQYLCIKFPPQEEEEDDEAVEAGVRRDADEDSIKVYTSLENRHTGAERLGSSEHLEADQDELDITDSPEEAMMGSHSGRPSSRRKTSARHVNILLDDLSQQLDFTPLESKSGRPFQFWQWQTFPPYLGYCLGLVLVMIVLMVLLGGFKAFITVLGIFSLSLETVLPLPALMTIIRNKSSAGFRMTVPVTWLLGDLFKTVFYFTTDGNSWIFKLSAIILVFGDSSVVALSAWYGMLGDMVRKRLGR